MLTVGRSRRGVSQLMKFRFQFRLKTIFVLVALAAVYLSSYFYLSRRGFTLSDDVGVSGVYFVVPESPGHSIANRFCVCVYFPIILIDYYLGDGRWPASDMDVWEHHA